MSKIRNIPAANSKSLANGLAKIEKLKEQLFVKEFLPQYARELAINYATYWDEQGSSLTGNTYTGLVIGLYKNGSLLSTYGVLDLGVKEPTRTETYVGDTGFYDYDSGEFIGDDKDRYVKNYDDYRFKFQDTNGGYGHQKAREFLTSYKPNIKKGYAIVACVGTSYAKWLERVRGLNVLTNTYLDAEGIAVLMFSESYRAYNDL